MENLTHHVDIPTSTSISIFTSISTLTPPSPPTTPAEMKWLTRTPTSGPSSPTPKQYTKDTSHPPPSPAESAPAESALAKAVRSLRSRPSFLSLDQPAKARAKTFPLSAPLNSPQREVKGGPFRPSSVRVVSEVLSVQEAGEYFARAMRSYEEEEGELRRRIESAQVRVRGMREWLYHSSSDDSEGVKKGRVDSGVHQHAEAVVDADEKMNGVEDSSQLVGEEVRISPLNEDVLWHSLFRLRNRTLLRFDCEGCQAVHKDTFLERGEIVWLLLGCGHFVSGRCFHKLMDVDIEDEVQNKSGEGILKVCRSCAHLRTRLRSVGEQELKERYRRLMEATRGFL